MRNSLMALWLAIFLFGSGARPVSAQVANTSSGGNASGTGGTVSYSVGQLSYTSTVNVNGSSNEGVQQPYEFFTVGIDDNMVNLSMVSVFPNPALSKVILTLGKEISDDASYQLFDLEGKLISSQKILCNETPIPLETLPSASYVLRVLIDKKEVKTFKIIKHN